MTTLLNGKTVMIMLESDSEVIRLRRLEVSLNPWIKKKEHDR